LFNVNLNPDTIFVIKITLTIKEITVYCRYSWVTSINTNIYLITISLTCEILTVFIFGVLLVKSANSSKINPNIGAIQHITCRLIRFHLYLLIQFEFVCTIYLFSWRSCFFSSFYYLTVILLYFYKCYRFYGTPNHNLRYTTVNFWSMGMLSDTIPL
jgi:hypothetical protein